MNKEELEQELAEYKEVFGSCETCKRTCDMGNCCDPRTKNGYLLDKVKVITERQKLLKENAELRKIAVFQQSSNMNTHFENKKLKEGLAVGSTWNKHLNSLNKALEEERDKYRNMVFDKDEQLTKATEIIKKLYAVYYDPCVTESDLKYRDELFAEIKQFLSEVEK
jgi:uncharacterized protein YicC (UPF0701 family)